MNPSTNSTEQQGDPNWSTDSWDSAAAAVTGLETRGQYHSNRLEWDWESQSMILGGQHQSGPASGGSADMSEEQRKPQQISASSMASNLRAYSTILSNPGFPPNFSQNPLGIFSSAGIRSFGGMDASSSLPTSSSHQGTLGSSGIPGLAATSGGHGDLRSYEQQRRRFFGQMDLDKAVHLTPTIKQEEVTQGEIGHARIGLNLGVRTYFATEDTAAGRMNKRHRANSPGSQVPMCQAEGCKADLSQAKHYHRRHKVCELHSKAANVIAAGHTQRFCQQCSRFHLLSEFDEGKRSCRKRLADHNRRRRKPQPTVSTSVANTADSLALVKVEDQDNRVNGSGGSLHRSAPVYGRSDERMQSIMLPGGGLALGSQGRQTSSQTYNSIEPGVPWLRPIGSRPTDNLSGQSLSRPGLTLQQHIMQASDKNGQASGGSNDPPSATQVYSQNLLASTITSRADMGSSDQWMLGSIRAAQSDREQQSTHFGSTLTVSSTQLENNQMLLSESVTAGDSTVGSGQTGRPAAEFLQQQQPQPQSQPQQQQSTSVPAQPGSAEPGDGTRSAGTTTTQPEMKYSELQALARPPFSTSSMIYDSHHNILTHGVSHFMMG